MDRLLSYEAKAIRSAASIVSRTVPSKMDVHVCRGY